MKRIISITLVALFLTVFCVSLSYGASKKVTKTITSDNTFTDAISPKFSYGSSSSRYIPTGIKRQNDFGSLNLSIYGFGTATVTLQIAYDFGTDWLDVKTYTSDVVERIWEYEEGVQFRVGVKTGDYTSGTIKVRLSK